MIALFIHRMIKLRFCFSRSIRQQDKFPSSPPEYIYFGPMLFTYEHIDFAVFTTEKLYQSIKLWSVQLVIYTGIDRRKLFSVIAITFIC